MKKLIKRLMGKLFNVPLSHDCAVSSPLAQYIDVTKLASTDSLVRLGTTYGGWLIPVASGLTTESVCYLAGAGEDISFDCALAERFHCNIRILDPTPRAVEHFKKLEDAIKSGKKFPIGSSHNDFYKINLSDFSRIKFLPIGLADQDIEYKFFLPKNPLHVSCSTVNLQKTDDYFMAQCYRLNTVMAQQGDKRVDLIKMDIEGAEYSVIKDILASGNLPRILLIEFDEAHTPLDSDAGLRIHDHITQLVRAGMCCVAVDGCNATFVRIEN